MKLKGERGIKGTVVHKAHLRVSDLFTHILAANEGRLFLWLPVACGLGILLYFAMSREPTLMEATLAGLLGATLLCVALFQSRGWAVLALLCAAWGLIGFALATARTQQIATPLLPYAMSVTLQGHIIDIEPMADGAQRLLIAPAQMERLEAGATPKYVRMKLRATQVLPVLLPGHIVEISGRLMPLPQPVTPGGFDFGRNMFFNGIGGTGFAYRAPVLLGKSTALTLQQRLNRLRLGIAQRVFETVTPKSTAAIAVALLTGYRGAIADGDVAALRGAGLAHLLAISGLHLGLVSGAFFFLIRFSLALVPNIALRYPTRKWAAWAALLGAIGYFLISGMSVPTLRAMVMTGIVLLAILLDRQPISMRLVAIAAFIVMALRPESLLGAGFHMSFAAVLALIAIYEVLRDQRGFIWQTAVRRNVSGYAMGLVVTSIVAGAATSLIAAYHFGRVAQFGLAGNVVAVPLTGFIIMPAGLLALLLMPFGLEAVLLKLMGLGIEGVMAAAKAVTSLPGAEASIPAGPPISFALIILGGLVLLVARGGVRALGVFPIMAALLFWNTSPKPDILIDRELRLVAVRGETGDMVYSSTRTGQFTRDVWQRDEGEAGATPPVASCDAYGCLFAGRGGTQIVLARTIGTAIEDCSGADVLIVQDYVRADLCAGPLIVDLGDAKDKGALALYLEADGYRVEQATPLQNTHRPWHLPVKAPYKGGGKY